MALEFIPARHALPNILIFDLVRVFGRDFHTAGRKRSGGFAAPGLELGAMWIVAHLADHEGGEVAEFVREHVVQALFVVDYFFGELDGAVMTDLVLGVGGQGAGADADLLSAPVGAAGGGFEGLGPDELDAAGCF